MGFSDKSLNNNFKNGLFEIIVDKIICCCNIMKKDYLLGGCKIDNNEVKIRNHLVEKYLGDNNVRSEIGLDKLGIGFIPEGPEKFDEKNDTYTGRVDIKIITGDWFRNTKCYYIAECKRIDGKRQLNNSYVKDGIYRFVMQPIKYESPHAINLMFGFVVRNINIPENTSEINCIQSNLMKSTVRSGLSLLKNDQGDWFLFLSSYNVDNKITDLEHLFYDFSTIIDEPKKSIKHHISGL
jgi:hypothetical protein